MSCLLLQHQKQPRGILYLQVEEFHCLHNDRCSNSPRGGRSRSWERPDFQSDCRRGRGIRGGGGGTILVYSVPVISLFDSGASHCYISTSFITKHSIPCYDMHTPWEISMGNGIITTSRVCRSCPVVICGKEFSADMFMINTGGYDVILGMIWLSKYHAVIDCRNKSVIF